MNELIAFRDVSFEYNHDGGEEEPVAVLHHIDSVSYTHLDVYKRQVRECIQPDVWETLERLREAGGICVMAHPFTYRSIDILKELTNAGLLDGIEVWQSKTTPEQEAFLEEFAGYHHLIKTGGSDFHGMFASKIAPIGKGSTPEESLEALFALREKKQKGIS